MYTHTHTHINEYVIYTQARYNSACEKYANRVQFACKVASREPRQVKLQQARLRLQRAVRGSGKWQAQLISNASSHFSLTLSLSVCVCILFHCTVASCAVTCAAIRKCFFNFPPKEVAKGRRGRWKAREEWKGKREEGGRATSRAWLLRITHSICNTFCPKKLLENSAQSSTKFFPRLALLCTIFLVVS